MKKTIFILMAFIFMVGCSEEDEPNIHESLNENLAIDTIQVVDVVDTAVEDGEPLDYDVLDRYIEVYDEKYNDLSDVDKGLYVQGMLIAQQAESFATLESSKKNFGMFKESILYYIEHGEKKEE